MATDYERFDEPRPRRSFGRALLLLLLAFILGIVAMGWAFTRWHSIGDYLERGGRSDAAAQGTQQPLAQTVAPTEPLTIVPAAPQPGALEDRIAQLESKVDRIDSRTQAVVGNADRAEALLVAFAARRALDRGADLGYIEALLRDRFGGSQPRAVATVIAAARQPVTLDELQASFDEIAPKLVTAGPEDSWWDGVRRELGNLIVVRRVDQPSTQPNDRLARARSQLSAGHVDLALAEVARLPGRAEADPWMAKAKRYVSARSALDMIETAALLQPAPPAASEPVWPAPKDVPASTTTTDETVPAA